jgi:hypothetical protein
MTGNRELLVGSRKEKKGPERVRTFGGGRE